MKEHILTIIKQIEIDYDVKILYVCESGSRAWGFSSKDSDYDIRFIYVHKTEWYLSIDQKRDVIEIPNDSILVPIHELLDVSGWELTKALKLFRKSNPPLLEWLSSTEEYYKAYSTIEKIKALSSSIFSPQTCLYHFLNMAQGNYQDCLKEQDVKIKKYINVLRPILAAKWIGKYRSFPPIEFQKLVEELVPTGDVKSSIDHLIKLKMAGNEFAKEWRMDSINHFIVEEMEHLNIYVKKLNLHNSVPTEQLNQLFRETLKEVWGNKFFEHEP
jgi:uncharacterized protein